GHALGASAGAESAGRAAKAARAKASATRVGFGRGRINVVGIKTELVVNLALLGIAKNVVGLGDFFEPLLRLLVTGIYIRMVLARQLAESLANLFTGSIFFDSQYSVIILGSSWHSSFDSSLRSSLRISPAVSRFAHAAKRLNFGSGWHIKRGASAPLNLIPQGLKPPSLEIRIGTAKAVPLRKLRRQFFRDRPGQQLGQRRDIQRRADLPRKFHDHVL